MDKLNFTSQINKESDEIINRIFEETKKNYIHKEAARLAVVKTFEMTPEDFRKFVYNYIEPMHLVTATMERIYKNNKEFLGKIDIQIFVETLKYYEKTFGEDFCYFAEKFKHPTYLKNKSR